MPCENLVRNIENRLTALRAEARASAGPWADQSCFTSLRDKHAPLAYRRHHQIHRHGLEPDTLLFAFVWFAASF